MTGDTRWRESFAWLLPVAIVVGCCGVPFLGIVVWLQPEAHDDLAATFAGRLLLTTLGIFIVVAAAALGIGMARILGFRWLSRLVGEWTTARVTGKSSETDAEGDVRWTVRVSGVAADGTGFAENLAHGSKEPPAFGTTMRVRYHRRTGVNLERRTVGGFIEAIIMDGLIALVCVVGLYSAALIAYGVVDVWTR